MTGAAPPEGHPRERVHKRRPTMGDVPKLNRADAEAALRNPLAFIADRWTPDPGPSGGPRSPRS